MGILEMVYWTQIEIKVTLILILDISNVNRRNVLMF